ncbi:MAG: hypothetical protein IJ366_04670 [Clostridia bacterium]|nr:hypothetical protein [Clostridia bacterium]
MKLKKILSTIIVCAAVLGTMGTAAFADSKAAALPEIDFTINEGNDWSDIINTATDTNNDGILTYGINGKVTVEGNDITVKDETVYFVPATGAATAELNIHNAASTYVNFRYNNSVKNVYFCNLTCSRTLGGWVGDTAHANNYFTTWASSAATVTYSNCTFSNGSSNNQYGKTVYTSCTFKNASEYCLWIYASKGNDTTVTVNDCAFEGKKGVKIYAENAAAEATTTITVSTFDIESKPAIVSSVGGTITLEKVDAAACENGLLANEYWNPTNSSSSELASVTVDGNTPDYVASVNGNLYTSTAYAEAEATKAGTAVQAVIAEINGTPYATLEAAVAAAEANDTITLTSDIDLQNNLWTPLTLPKDVNFNGNGKTIKNLKIEGGDNAALFESVTGKSVVENLTIENVNVKGGKNVAALAGSTISSCNFKNIKITGDIKIEGNYKVGGIIGGGYSMLTA